MDFDFNSDQEMLRNESRKFLEKACNIEKVREVMEDKKGFSPDLWQQVSELGWPALIIPEEYGGIGMTFIDLIVVMEEMGRALFPSPFFFHLMATFAVLEGGTEEQKQKFLAEIATGETIATFAHAEPGDCIDIRAVQAEAQESGDGFVLNGTKSYVGFAHVANLIIAPFRTGKGNGSEGITLFIIDSQTEGVNIDPLRTIDLTRKTCQVTFHNVKVGKDQVLGEVGKGGPVLREIIKKSTVALCAEMIGGSEAIHRMAVEYAKIRMQFGVPIGTFQGIKHPLADVFVSIELAKGLVYYAALAVQDNLEDVDLAVSMAKAAITDAYTEASMNSILTHGGVGYTWECDAHLYLRRAKWSEYSLGDADYHRERIAQMIGLENQ